MALVPWKTGLPTCAQTWSEQDQPNVIRTEMDVGPPKVRRRSTLRNRLVQVSWTMPATLYQQLVEFYETDTLQGIHEFEYAHPITKTLDRYRFTGPPSYQFIGGKNGVAAFQVSCEWELQF